MLKICYKSMKLIELVTPGGNKRGGTIVSNDTQGHVMLHADRSGLALSNTESILGKTIVEFYGVVSGNTVRAKHIGRDITAVKQRSRFEPRLGRF